MLSNDNLSDILENIENDIIITKEDKKKAKKLIKEFKRTHRWRGSIGKSYYVRTK